jgi:hypothetical protein
VRHRHSGAGQCDVITGTTRLERSAPQVSARLGKNATGLSDPMRGNHAERVGNQAPAAATEALEQRVYVSLAGLRNNLYIPIAWYPLSTYSVVPVTLAAPGPRR